MALARSDIGHHRGATEQRKQYMALLTTCPFSSGLFDIADSLLLAATEL